MIVKTEDDSKVFWLFLQPEVAQAMHATMQQSTPGTTLKVSAVPLGMVYNKLARVG